MKLAAFLACVAVAHASSGTCTVLDAAGSKCTGTCKTSTTAPVKGQNFTITAAGTCSEDITAASYHVSGTFGGLPVLNHDEPDACVDTDFPIGGALNLGHMYIAKAGCTVPQGAKLKLVSTAFVSKLAPPATLKADLVAKDGAGNKILELEVDVTM